MVQFLTYFLLFMLGASVGSFLNVLISRSIAGKDWVKGRSVCDHCGQSLTWYDTIPVFAFMIYRGKSRCCHKSLSIQHPVVEILTGMLFVWWLAVGSLFFRLVTHPLSTLQPLFWLLTGLILVGIFITDLFYYVIPTYFVGAGVFLVSVYRIILGIAGAYQWRDLGLSFAAATGAWAFFWFLRYITQGKGMGDGDVILAFFLGLLLGWPKTPVGLLLSFVIGAAVSLVLVAGDKKKMKSTVPFGPFMITGTVITLIFGETLLKILWGV